MTQFIQGIIWLCCILQTFVYICQGLKCLQCNSYEMKHCFWGTLKAKECPKKNQKYCITYSGELRESGTHILFRDCSTENMTTDCQMVTVSNKVNNETKPVRFRLCHHSCDTDGCNDDVHEREPSSNRSSAISAQLIRTLIIMVVTIASVAVSAV